MRIERFLLASRSALVICAFSLAAMAVGCGEGESSAPASGTVNTAEQQAKEQAAREAAYGKGGNTKAAPAPGDANKSKAGSSGSKPN